MATIRQLYEQRIKAECPQFKEVAGAANLQSILDGRIEVNGLYIFRESVATAENKWFGAVIQPFETVFGVVIATKNVRNQRGVDSSDECEILADLVREKLLGWTPSEGYTPTEYRPGGMVGMKNNLYLWKERYRTVKQIRNFF